MGHRKTTIPKVARKAPGSKVASSIIKREDLKYKIIQITDLQLHTTKKTPTLSVGKKLQKAFEADKPDRIYSKVEKTAISDNRTFTLELLKMDPDFVRMVQEEEAKGYKGLIALPN